MRITDTHVYFWGSELSNFYEAPTTIMFGSLKISYPTSEHAYMAFKALAFGDAASFKELLKKKHSHPADAKAIGRNVKNFNQKIWDQIKYDRMYKAVYAKFSQNKKLKEFLLNTETRILVEGSPIDKIWGVGIRYDDDRILNEANWDGENLLGKVLMDVRQEFWDCEDNDD